MAAKVIYVSYMPFTDKVRHDYLVDFFLEKSIGVEYWDIVSLVRDEYVEHGALTSEFVRRFRTYRDLEDALHLETNQGATFIMLFSYEGRFTEVFRLMSKCGCRMVSVSWGRMPIGGVPLWRRIRATLSAPHLLASRVWLRLKASAYRKLGLIKPFDVALVAGEALVSASQYAARVVPINSTDYESYVRTRSEPGRVVRGSYAVFLDNNLPFHPDFKFCGVPLLNPQLYYASLNRFFKIVESTYDVNVVVAAHPKANYGPEMFEGREVWRGCTPELVRDATFVISHHSISLSYAILNLKPIVLIYTSEMQRLYEDAVLLRALRGLADYLQVPMLNVDEVVHAGQVEIREVDVARYNAYKYAYLTSHASENMATQEIVWNALGLG